MRLCSKNKSEEVKLAKFFSKAVMQKFALVKIFNFMVYPSTLTQYNEVSTTLTSECSY